MTDNVEDDNLTSFALSKDSVREILELNGITPLIWAAGESCSQFREDLEDIMSDLEDKELLPEEIYNKFISLSIKLDNSYKILTNFMKEAL